MLSQVGTTSDEIFERYDGMATSERWDFAIWSLIAFAMGMLSAWIGALVWIGVQFLTV